MASLTLTEFHELERDLAYTSAATLIESHTLCVGDESEFIDAVDLDSADELAKEEIDEAVAYLEARGLIDRDSKHPAWISIRDQGESIFDPAVSRPIEFMAKDAKGGPLEIAGFTTIHPDIAVNPCMYNDGSRFAGCGLWNVTHIPSGYCYLSQLPNREMALIAAVWIAKQPLAHSGTRDEVTVSASEETKIEITAFNLLTNSIRDEMFLAFEHLGVDLTAEEVQP